MRKFFVSKKYLCLCIAIAFILHGCGVYKESKQVNLNFTLREDATANTAFTTAVFETEMNGGKIRVHYPQMDSMESNAETINALLQTAGETLLWETYAQDDSRQIDAELEYSITYQSDEVLSVIFTGLGNVQGAAHPNHLFYSLNIDLNCGKVLYLSDLCAIDQTLVDEIQTAAKEQLSEPIMQYLEQNSDEKWLELLGEADKVHCGVRSYLTQSCLVVAIAVPYAIGDWVEVEVPVH